MRESNRLSILIEQHSIDLLHILYAEPNALWASMPDKLGVPVVITTRGSDILKTIPRFIEGRKLLSRLVANRYRKAFHAAAAITATSQAQIEALQRMFGVASSRVHLIRTGADDTLALSNTIASLPAELHGIRYVFFPRAMHAVYRHEDALDAIALLPEAIRRSHHFVFIDADGSPTDYIRMIAERMRTLEARIIWLNRQSPEALSAALKTAELVVMTPESDGSPVTAMESMMCRTAVVLPPLPYDPELFGEGVIVASSASPAGYANAIEGVLTGKLKPNTDAAFNRVMATGNRRLEMTRLLSLYDALKSEEA